MGVMSGWWTSSTKDTHNFTLLLLYTNIMSEKFECSISICGQSISEQSRLSVLWQIDRDWVEYYSTDACFPLAWYFSVSLLCTNRGRGCREIYFCCDTCTGEKYNAKAGGEGEGGVGGQGWRRTGWVDKRLQSVAMISPRVTLSPCVLPFKSHRPKSLFIESSTVCSKVEGLLW